MPLPPPRSSRVALTLAVLLVTAVTTGAAAPPPADETATLAGQLGLGAREKLVVRDIVTDPDGTTHTRYDRTYAGLPVLGGDLVVREDRDGTVEGVTSAAPGSVEPASLTARVSPAKAGQQAMTAASGEMTAASAEGATASAPRKVIWAASGRPVLAYETVIDGVQQDGTPQELHVVTDAATGARLYAWDGVMSGIGNSQHSGRVTLGTTPSGSEYQLVDPARGGHRTYDAGRQMTSALGTVLTDADDVWGTGTPADVRGDQTAAVDAAYGAQATWDFYQDVFSRAGVRGDGVAPPSRVHYGDKYGNAFWSDNCFCMTYGDGAGNVKPLTSLDIVGHEITHGVTSNTVHLVFSGESLALNEATSDILGTAIEFHANNPADPGDYLIGEKLDINGNGTPLRYLDKPSKDGASKDSWYAGIGSAPAHNASGVANHFFFLLAEGSGRKTLGGVTYDSPTSDGSTLTGIGRDKAVRIWYTALTRYMTSTSGFREARTATLSAAEELFGAGSAEVRAVGAAWSAVNVN
ncbi:MAG TPA: M4 family metallopeptidase [Streptomyces sp.]